MSSQAGKRSSTTVANAGSHTAVAPSSGVGKRTLVEQIVAPVQQRGAGEPSSGAERATDVHTAAARGIVTPSTTLPHYRMIQRAFGRHDISAVQAHVAPEARASADAMGADAYATGNHVVLGKGSDLFTTAHEAAHVVQQRGGVQLKGGVGEVGDAHERHADDVASLVVQGKSAEGLLDRYASDGVAATGASSVQRMDRDGAGTSDIGTMVRPLREERLQVTYLNMADQVGVQRDRVVQTAQRELSCYREVSRVIAREVAAGRLQLSPGDAARTSKLHADLDELSAALQQPPPGDVTGHGKWSVDLLTRAEFAKQQGNALVDAHAEAILPLVRDIEALNELVQIRLDRVAQGYKDELESAQDFQGSHKSGIGLSSSLQPDLRATYTALRQDVELARAETTVETTMLHMLGSALLAEVEGSSDTPGNHVLRFFSSSAANHRRAENSAVKHKQEIEATFGDVYEASAEGGALDLKLKPEGVGSVRLLDLEERMTQTLAGDDPAYMASGVRAAVAANPEFEHDTTKRPFGKQSERVMMAPETYQRLYAERGGPGLPAPRERLVTAGLAADRASKLNRLKFSLTSDARETIDAAHRKWGGWSNLRTELTHQKMLLLIRTMDAIILCQTADSLLQVIHGAEQEHAQLLRRWHKKDGGNTARTLARWSEAVRSFMA